METVLYAVIILLAVLLCVVLEIARELGGLARDLMAVHFHGADLPLPPSSHSRFLTWLMRPKAPMVIEPLPSPAHGVSPPSPPLNCHVGSERPAPARH
jgi:hypothetical protein